MKIKIGNHVLSELFREGKFIIFESLDSGMIYVLTLSFIKKCKDIKILENEEDRDIVS